MSEKKLFTHDEIKQKLVNYCVYQDRCHFEVENKMKEFLLIPEAKDQILLYLIKENYLNEERFARSYTRGKFYIKKWGRIKIKLHLIQKKINEKLIKKSFTEINDEDYQNTISDLIEKLTINHNNISEFSQKNKIIKHLLAKGFEYEIILSMLDVKKT